MPVLIGLFASYRDANEALRVLQTLGLDPRNGHLYEESRRVWGPSSCLETLDETSHAEERAEYAAHGEYLSICGAANRFRAATGNAEPAMDVRTGGADASMRTLLIIDLGGLRPAQASGVLYDYGAVAVKDPAGHWRFSPYRKVCRSQE